MALNIPCCIENCKEDSEFVCSSHPTVLLLCNDHRIIHKKETKHNIECINDNQLSTISITLLKSKINSCIHQMSKEAEEIITKLKSVLKSAIKDLKETNQNLTSISKFKPFIFNKERVSFMMSEIDFIVENDGVLKENKFEILQKKYDEKTEELLKTQEEFEKLKEKYDELNEAYTLKQKDYESLQNELDDQTQQFLHRENSLNEQLVENESHVKTIESLKRSLSIIEEQKQREKEEWIQKLNGYLQLDFRKLDLAKKIEFMRVNWSFISLSPKSLEVLISNDDKYIFYCKRYAGIINEDCNEYEVSEYY